ncbi:lanthionine synthetase C family protein [Paenibacillus campi]|uniref:lanthionine synthetase C family protein n=1 Tax=Paenibacillus campi TaxID=3106031 RepID=UPI002AFFE6DB|nr:lanthionine synthetase C family protein [Paenibacillus sp. SGZ-1014]
METSAITATGLPIVDRIKQIALNMQDYDRLLAIVTHPHNDLQFGDERIRPWNVASLSHGIPGICMLYAELHAHFPEEGWDQRGHHYLSILVQHIAQEGIQRSSLFAGAAGIGLATVCLSQNGQLYGKFTQRIHEYLLVHVPFMLDNASTGSVRSGDYDVIEGLSGIAAYLLSFRQDEQIRSLLERVLDYLIELAQPIQVGRLTVPGWHIPAANQFSEREKQQYPDGNFNLGLSHGIPGPLVVLCKAWQQGVRRTNQLQAIHEMGAFVIQFASTDQHGHRFWKGCIGMDEFQQGKAHAQTEFRRDAWCYGSPGVCVALWHAGEVLARAEWKQLALDTLEHTLEHIHHIYSPTFCHGFAGIAQIASNFQLWSGSPRLQAHIDRLKATMMEHDDPQYAFGFANLEHFEQRGMTAVQYAGLLDGTTGTALTLLHLELGQRTPWQHAFLL